MKKIFGTLFATVMLVLALPLNALAADIEVNVSSTVPAGDNIIGNVNVQVENSTEPDLVLEDIRESGNSGTISNVTAASEVSVDCTPANGYKLDNVTVTRDSTPDDPQISGGIPVAIANDAQNPNVYTFNMPNVKVFVDIIFSKIAGRNPNPGPQPSTVTPMPVSTSDNSGSLAETVNDRNTFKSETLSKNVMVYDNLGSSLEFRVHATDERTNINQKFLAQYLVGPTADILLTQNIYPRRDLTMAEDGATKTLTWNNLPKYQAGPVYAVIYNEIDGAYVLNGILDANGTAVFNSTGFYGFKLRNASTITICRIR